MRDAQPSRTAQYVAQVRAVLTAKHVIDDPYARPMLTRPMRLLTTAMLLPIVRKVTDSPFFAALATRVRFFDDEVAAAVRDGIPQVVIIGAGYDSRAWRFASSSVLYFEVDHPATQDDKRRRAARFGGDPVYVGVDLAREPIVDALSRAAFAWHRPALFALEGFTMYLDRDSVERLLADLAVAAAPESRLAINFAAPPGTGSPIDRVRLRFLRTAGAAGGEAHRFFLNASQAGPFVASTGWTPTDARSLRDRARASVASTSLRYGRINQEASAVAAIRGDR